MSWKRVLEGGLTPKKGALKEVLKGVLEGDLIKGALKEFLKGVLEGDLIKWTQPKLRKNQVSSFQPNTLIATVMKN